MPCTVAVTSDGIGVWLSSCQHRHLGKAVAPGTERLEARIIDWTLHHKPADGSTHWSSRKLAAKLGISYIRVARVWAKAGLQPSRRRHYMASDDPAFESKAADIIGLYLKPPATRPCSAWMKRAPFRLSIGWIRFCPFRPGVPSATAFRTSDMALCRSLLVSRERNTFFSRRTSTVLSPAEKEKLTLIANRPKSNQRDALRARIILEASEGLSNTEIARRERFSLPTVGKWRSRYARQKIEALADAPRSGAPRSIDDKKVEEVPTKTLETTPRARTHWSSRLMAKEAGISEHSVLRIWRAFGLTPHGWTPSS